MPRAQAQVVEPDVDQEFQAVADLADQVAGDVLLIRRSSFKFLEEGVGTARAATEPIWSSVKSWNRTRRRVVARAGPMHEAAHGTSSTIPWSLKR